MKLLEGSVINCEGTSYILKSRIDNNNGGNATVWLAEVDGDPNQYAVKILDSVNAKRTDKLDRFREECEFCKKSNHPNILKVYSYIAERDNAFCIMPYYEDSLRSIINMNSDIFDLLSLIIKLCEAIQYIHKQGIIHRDLKPENILVNRSGMLVLADFGIAHFVDSTKTKNREWLGNRRYAAPEQLATDELTCACDIYALGRIINEVFTKKNPSGESIMTISDIIPLLSPLDRIVERCRNQNPEQRPLIDELLIELRLLDGELKDNLDSIQECLYPSKTVGYSIVEEDAIVEQASKDIVIAQNMFDTLPDERLEEINTDYHRNILYNAEAWLQNLYFQLVALDYCVHKFEYESHYYNENTTYKPLDLENEKDALLYKRLNLILEKHQIPYNYKHITAHIRKLFCSCCDYHCEELLANIMDLDTEENHLLHAPVLHIVYMLRHKLPKEFQKGLSLIDNISICWETKPLLKIEENQMYSIDGSNEIDVLLRLKQKYDVVYEKTKRNEYYVRFKSEEKFNDFKEYALEISHADFVFEGDVEKIIRIKRKYCGIVELEPLDSFDVTNTLSRILDNRINN